MLGSIKREFLDHACVNSFSSLKTWFFLAKLIFQLHNWWNKRRKCVECSATLIIVASFISMRYHKSAYSLPRGKIRLWIRCVTLMIMLQGHRWSSFLNSHDHRFLSFWSCFHSNYDHVFALTMIMLSTAIFLKPLKSNPYKQFFIQINRSYNHLRSI